MIKDDTPEQIDELRTAASALTPDPRTQRTLASQHDIIGLFVLSPSVPESVRTHFETAKNLYLYAWFVYRFYMVSEHYVCSTLELALRERLKEHFSPAQLRRPPSLGELMRMAAIKRLLNNARLPSRQQRITSMAQERLRHEQMELMMQNGLTEMQIDYSQAQPNQTEIDFDWISHFAEYLPRQRNLHAHGSEHLYPDVLFTFEIISELINQLYEVTD